MPELLVGAASAFWLGVLTSISPCPLATNVAAISFVGRRLDSPFRALVSGALYTLGRSLSYVLLGFLLVSSLLSAPHLSHWLQKHMNELLGPVLILAGMFLLELLSFDLPGFRWSERARERALTQGAAGTVLLGALFALSFCPISAALFFGSLLPVAARLESSVLLPALYGIGTGLPVLVFGSLLVVGARSVGPVFERLGVFERWARRVTGLVFVTIGILFSLRHIFGVPL